MGRLQLFVAAHEYILHEVGAHLQRSKMLFGRVAVHFEVFPAIAEVGFVAVKAHQAALVDQAIALGRLVVVLVYFWQAIGKSEFLVIDRV